MLWSDITFDIAGRFICVRGDSLDVNVEVYIGG